MSQRSLDPLSHATLVYVAPRPGSSGVSDYADDMLIEARGAFGHVVEIRHGGAGQDSVRDVIRARRAIRAAVRAAPGAVVVHAEQSGGVLVPFWGLAQRAVRDPRVIRSATLHDAPLGVWLPWRTRGIGRSRLLVHALHYPTMPLSRALERRVLSGVHLSALTASGAEAITAELGHGPVAVSFLPPPARPVLPPAPQRPLAVGLFGYVYKGKGFQDLERLRALIDDRIAIRVAGRGTELLPPVPGVEILGGVEGAQEDAFFGGVRAILLPYGRRSSYGPQTHVASSVAARAIAYRTPVIALRYPGLSDEAEIVDGGIDELAAAVNRLVLDDEAMARLDASVQALGERLTVPEAFRRLATSWRAALPAA